MRSYKDFSTALAEQICESFVAYILNIVPNPKGWTDFTSENFASKQLGSSKKYQLIDKLWNASLISSPKK